LIPITRSSSSLNEETIPMVPLPSASFQFHRSFTSLALYLKKM
jgi:hypothetical protein